MLPKILLRVAAVLMFIHGILHTIGFTSWKTDANRQDVVKAMNGPKLPFMGASRNIAEFYDGFGYASTIALLLMASLLWVVSGELLSNVTLSKKVILILAFALLFWGADELIYFFPFAVCITWLSCLCSFWAFFGLRQQKP